MSKRDFVMARLAAARTAARQSIDAIDVCMEFCMDGDDEEGDQRREAMDLVLDFSGAVSRSIESAQEVFDSMSAEDLAEGEDDDEDDEDDGE